MQGDHKHEKVYVCFSQNASIEQKRSIVSVWKLWWILFFVLDTHGWNAKQYKRKIFSQVIDFLFLSANVA